MSFMPIAIAVPGGAVQYEERGPILRVSGVEGGPLELRVDEGLVFARYLSKEPRLWSNVTLPSLLAFFAENSPVATFLRRHGAFPLRQLVLDAKTSGPGVGE
jgi:hypothetical protein